ncbi:hypothetical protein ACSS6W_003423 [Trichoderma asperelloides]
MLVFGVLSRSGRRHFSLSALDLLLRIVICHLDQLLLYMGMLLAEVPAGSEM